MSNLKTSNFLLDLRWAKRKKYCANRFCTTCGATPLRKLLSKYTEAEIIEGMKKISGEYLNQFIDCIEGKEILIFLFYQLTKTGSGNDLIEIFEGKPICIFLHEAIQFKENRKLKHQRILENQHETHLNKLNREKSKAQHNIWNAIRRHDFLAINHLLKKGIDLEVQKDGKVLKDLLIEMKVL